MSDTATCTCNSSPHYPGCPAKPPRNTPPEVYAPAEVAPQTTPPEPETTPLTSENAPEPEPETPGSVGGSASSDFSSDAPDLADVEPELSDERWEFDESDHPAPAPIEDPAMPVIGIVRMHPEDSSQDIYADLSDRQLQMKLFIELMEKLNQVMGEVEEIKRVVLKRKAAPKSPKLTKKEAANTKLTEAEADPSLEQQVINYLSTFHQAEEKWPSFRDLNRRFHRKLNSDEMKDLIFKLNLEYKTRFVGKQPGDRKPGRPTVRVRPINETEAALFEAQDFIREELKKPEPDHDEIRAAEEVQNEARLLLGW